MERLNTYRNTVSNVFCLVFLIAVSAIFAVMVRAQEHENEIVASLAGGRVIVQVASGAIVFAAIDQPIEASSIPPRVLSVDSTHIAILLGASEWQVPADPKPARLDKNFARVSGRDPRYETSPDEAEPDLEAIGVAFLEKLRPLAAQLHHRVEFKPDEALLEVVLIGYAPNNYGPEVWALEYRMEQEEIAARGDYWQTRVLRPRFTQLYPPEKHATKILVELHYPGDAKGQGLLDLIKDNDPRIAQLRSGEPRFAKVIENIERGQASKSASVDAADFLRAALPLIAGKATFFLGTMDEERGFNWIVPPEEPVEKAKEEKNRPPEAPSLIRKPKP